MLVWGMDAHFLEVIVKIISIIAALDENGCIGGNNSLLWHIPEDMKWFKEQTLFKAVIMGRKTYESLPNTLPNRRMVVVSHEVVEGDVDHYFDIKSAIKGYEGEIMIIGGGSIYEQTIDIADRLYLTRVEGEHDVGVDNPVYFPDVDFSDWYQIYSRPGDGCEFQIWCRKKLMED